MKKILYILLFVPLALFGQEEDPCFSINNVFTQLEASNPEIEINLLSGWNMIGYPCSQEIIASEAFSSIINDINIVKDNNGNVFMPEFGFNGIGFLEGGQGYQIKMSNAEYGFSFCESINLPHIEGCTDCESSNFNQWASINDESCEYDSDGDGINDSNEIAGCLDSAACNYNELATDSLICNYPFGYYDCLGVCINDIDADAVCDELEISGCTDLNSLNYNDLATEDDSSCIPIILGCTNSSSCNFNELANVDDESCEGSYVNIDFGSDTIFGCSSVELGVPLYEGVSYLWNTILPKLPAIGSYIEGGVLYYRDATEYSGYVTSIYNHGPSLPGCQASSSESFGAGPDNTINSNEVCPNSTSRAPYIVSILNENDYSDWFLPSRDEVIQMSCVQDLISSISIAYGGDNLAGNYQTSTYYNSSFVKLVGLNGNCDYSINQSYNCCGYEFYYRPTRIVNLPANNISTLNYTTVLSSGWTYISITDTTGCQVIDSVYVQIDVCGCTDENACNYTNSATLDNDLCLLPDYGFDCNGDTIFGCTDELACNFLYTAANDDGSCFYPEYGYDCNGMIALGIGEYIHGGILFYIDETGQHGLVAAVDDLDNNSTWNDAIINASTYIINEYDDWYLPSLSELSLIYSTIGLGGVQGNLAGFETSFFPDYWSSTENNISNSWKVDFSNGVTSTYPKSGICFVRPIRSF